MEKYLKNLYNNSYIFNTKKLYELTKIEYPEVTYKNIKDFKNKQTGQQIYYKEINKKEYLPITSDSIYSFQIDLTFLPKYKSSNKNYSVLFTAINIISRFAYCYYSKDKKGSTILNFLKEMNKLTKIEFITCDEGTEFNNKEFIKYCEENNIKIFFVKDDSNKLSKINRFHRTLKENIMKLFVVNKNVNWIKYIDDIIKNYNNTENRMIKTTPQEAENNIYKMTDIIYEDKEITQKIKNEEKEFNIGDYCRIKIKRKNFDKTPQNYSDEIYYIEKVNKIHVNY